MWLTVSTIWHVPVGRAVKSTRCRSWRRYNYSSRYCWQSHGRCTKTTHERWNLHLQNGGKFAAGLLGLLFWVANLIKLSSSFVYWAPMKLIMRYLCKSGEKRSPWLEHKYSCISCTRCWVFYWDDVNCFQAFIPPRSPSHSSKQRQSLWRSWSRWPHRWSSPTENPYWAVLQLLWTLRSGHATNQSQCSSLNCEPSEATRMLHIKLKKFARQISNATLKLTSNILWHNKLAANNFLITLWCYFLHTGSFPVLQHLVTAVCGCCHEGHWPCHWHQRRSEGH